MTKPTYAEMLRDPRWQRKRLEVMDRDDFGCRHCGEKHATLNVHHTFYRRNTAPWEYPDDSLVTLCEPCHDLIQNWTEGAHRAIGRLKLDELQRATGFARVLWADRVGDPEGRVAVETFCIAEGIGDYLMVPAEEILVAILPALKTVEDVLRALPTAVPWSILRACQADWKSGETLRTRHPAGA
jgi:hypothetical protein